MNYRQAKKLQKRVNDLRLVELSSYHGEQLRRATILLRRHWLRGCERVGRYEITDTYYAANRLEAQLVRLRFFVWKGRGVARVYVGGRGTLRKHCYLGMPYTPDGKLMFGRGIKPGTDPIKEL